jgi:hypothetical protein
MERVRGIPDKHETAKSLNWAIGILVFWSAYLGISFWLIFGGAEKGDRGQIVLGILFLATAVSGILLRVRRIKEIFRDLQA